MKCTGRSNKVRSTVEEGVSIIILCIIICIHRGWWMKQEGSDEMVGALCAGAPFAYPEARSPANAMVVVLCFVFISRLSNPVFER